MEHFRSPSGAARRAEFKAPPSARPGSQIERRARALEEQKRQRALRVNAARNIDLLGSLSLGLGTDDDDDDVEVPHEGVGSFVSMMQPQPGGSEAADPNAAGPSSPPNNKKRNRKKRNSVNSKNGLEWGKPTANQSKWANVAMFAELLELRDDDVNRWDVSPETVAFGSNLPDGGHSHRRRALPPDLETGWVALAPIPAGKRCIAISHSHQGYSSGYDVSSTHLHSRLKGTKLLKFPSGLPPNSMLDCILDANWQETGIIHVLDIIRWRGTDFVDCEAEFRFWWRDARVSEITSVPPSRRRRKPNGPLLFEYPTLFVPVPHCNPPIPLRTYLLNVIPQARTVREITVPVFVDDPVSSTTSMDVDADQQDVFGNKILQIEENMAVDASIPGTPRMTTLTARVETDGLLLYVSEASYQPGETPLSCWVPAAPLDRADAPSMLDLFEQLIMRQLESEAAIPAT